MIYSTHLALAEAVVTEGFARHEPGVVTLLGEARPRGISEVLLEVLADRSAPRVVRERALGRVIVAIENPGPRVSEQRRRLASCPDVGTADSVGVFERACAWSSDFMHSTAAATLKDTMSTGD